MANRSFSVSFGRNQRASESNGALAGVQAAKTALVEALTAALETDFDTEVVAIQTAIDEANALDLTVSIDLTGSPAKAQVLAALDLVRQHIDSTNLFA